MSNIDDFIVSGYINCLKEKYNINDELATAITLIYVNKRNIPLTNFIIENGKLTYKNIKPIKNNECNVLYINKIKENEYGYIYLTKKYLLVKKGFTVSFSVEELYSLFSTVVEYGFIE